MITKRNIFNVNDYKSKDTHKKAIYSKLKEQNKNLRLLSILPDPAKDELVQESIANARSKIKDLNFLLSMYNDNILN